MKKLIISMVAALVMGNVAFAADGLGDDNKGQKRSKHQRPAAVRDVERTTVGIRVSFSTRDVGVIREYYAPRYRKLPPGLQKKLARTGTLPPGWRKKMEPFPVELERHLVVLPPGYHRGVIDGHAVIYRPQTQVIFDVAVLF